MVIVIYYHPAQALVQRYIIADIIGCNKDTKTVSYYLLCYLVLIYDVSYELDTLFISVPVQVQLIIFT